MFFLSCSPEEADAAAAGAEAVDASDIEEDVADAGTEPNGRGIEPERDDDNDDIVAVRWPSEDVEDEGVTVVNLDGGGCDCC